MISTNFIFFIVVLYRISFRRALNVHLLLLWIMHNLFQRIPFLALQTYLRLSSFCAYSNYEICKPTECILKWMLMMFFKATMNTDQFLFVYGDAVGAVHLSEFSSLLRNFFLQIFHQWNSNSFAWAINYKLILWMNKLEYGIKWSNSFWLDSSCWLRVLHIYFLDLSICDRIPISAFPRKSFHFHTRR